MQQIIKKIKTQVSAPMRVAEHTIELSVAGGYAIYPDEGTSFEELYLAADKKMYKDKAGKKGKSFGKQYEEI